MDPEQQNHLRAGMESVINTLNTVFGASCEMRERDENISRLRKCLTDLITEENKAQRANQAMSKIRGYLTDSLLEGQVVQNMEEMFSNAVAQEKEPKLRLEKHEMMAKFESRLAKLHANCLERERFEENLLSEDNDDAEASDDEAGPSTIDPVTNEEMHDPVKNKRCGHSYERASIFKLLTKSGMLCPAVGCDTKLREKDLVDNFELKAFIERKQR